MKNALTLCVWGGMKEKNEMKDSCCLPSEMVLQPEGYFPLWNGPVLDASGW